MPSYALFRVKAGKRRSLPSDYSIFKSLFTVEYIATYRQMYDFNLERSNKLISARIGAGTFL